MISANTRKVFFPKLLVTATASALLLFAAQSNAATVQTSNTAEASVERAGVFFSGRIGLGYLTGEAHEYVYWPEAGDHTASELTWEIDSLYMFGTGGSLGPLEWLTVNGDIWFNIGDGDGYMEDLDWRQPGMAWTDRSLHEDTDVTQGIMLDINVEMTAFSNSQVALTGLAGYRRDNFEWEARGGSYIYSVNGFRDATGTFIVNEPGITYEQTFNVPYIGIGFTGDFDPVRLSAKVIGSPFVSGEAVDHHHLRNLTTYDDFSGESMLAFDVAIEYGITDAMGIKAAYFYEKYDTMKGDSEWHYNGGIVVNYPDSGGADLETSMFSFTFNYYF